MTTPQPILMALLALVIGSTAMAGSVAAADESGDAALELFEQRIMPIFRSPKPSSCVQCHLAAVDLKDYILPSHKETFASLREQKLVDVDRPEQSKILTLIQMGEQDVDQGAKLIHEKTRQAEYEAFAAWINACCRDPELRSWPVAGDSQRLGPDRPDAVVRHARKSRIVDSFVRNVWSQRMRCYPCHTPHEFDHSNPKHQMAIERAEEFAQQYGERMNLFRETPEATMEYLIQRSRETGDDSLPLINLQTPAKSLIVLKPTSKLPKQIAKGEFEEPSYVDPVSHMGGLKMHPNDYSYKSFLAWIEDYARVVGDEYASVAELPRDNWVPTQHAFFLQDTPTDWPALTPVQLFFHRWDEESGGWSAEPAAFTQGMVNPRRVVFGILFLFEDGEAEVYPAGGRRADESGVLPAGRYLLKAYVDRSGRLAEEPIVFLDGDDFGGQMEIEAKWGIGFPEAERISAEALQK